MTGATDPFGDFNKLPIVRRLQGDEPPPILYHYTSRRGLQGILEARAIWASEARYLNDARELSTAIDHVQELLSGRPASDLYTGMRHILELMKVGQDTFVFSMSNDGGDELSQWRAYARPGNGYAIGFDAPAMQQMFRAAALTSHFAPCEYDQAKQRALMAEVIDNAEVAMKMHGAGSVEAATTLFATLFLLAAPTIKDAAFRAENEWRLVLPAFTIWNARVKFREAGHLLVPYWIVPLAAAGAALPIKEVVIGPTPHPELEARAVSAILSIAGLPKATVRKSKVPYRDW